MGTSNTIINGDFNVWQRGASFITGTNPTVNNNYYADRWVLLSGNDTAKVNGVADVIRSTNADAPDGSLYAIKSTVTVAGEATNNKFGFLQIIEQANCQHLIGSTASLSFQAKTAGAAIRNIRAAIISWTGTADSVTRDVVSDWENEGVNPTLVTSWTYENIPSDLSLTTDYQLFKIENISIGKGTNNVAVFIWIDDTDASAGPPADVLYLGQVQLEKGATATDFEYRTIGEKLALCQRYYERINFETPPAYPFIGSVQSRSSTEVDLSIAWKTIKRTNSGTISYSAKTDLRFEIGASWFDADSGSTVVGSSHFNGLGMRVGSVPGSMTVGLGGIVSMEIGGWVAGDHEL